ncbi:MAG: adenylate/guanylate cyclase domain-containing protein [Chromatiales bacterium]|jgi:adenylate cyclase
MHSQASSQHESSAAAGGLSDFWRRFENSALPLALKWSFSISILIVTGMTLLGTFLISQHERSYQQQTIAMGSIIAEQLAHAISEPLMADDQFTLNLILARQAENPLITGLEVFDNEYRLMASVGNNPYTIMPSEIKNHWQAHHDEQRRFDVTSFTAEVRFKDVLAGYARVSLDNEPLQESLNSLQFLLAMVTIVLILLTVLLVFPLSRRLNRPIDELVQTSLAIHSDEAHEIPLDTRRDEIGQIINSFKQLSDDKREKKQLEQTFHRYMSPTIARHVIAQTHPDMGGHAVTGSVLFCDIVGFTELSEQLAPAETVTLLNSYFRYFALAATECHGTIDKFIGDCIMVVFSIPNEDPQHGLHAITCALLMQALTERINQARRLENLRTLQFRIGISSGEMQAGNLGSEERMEYTVIGDTVNLASRLCSLATPGGIMVYEKTRNQMGIDDKIQSKSMGEIAIRGRKRPAHIYQITGLTRVYSDSIAVILEKILPLQ